MMREANAFLTQAWEMWKSDSRAESVIAVGMILGGVLLAFGPDVIGFVRRVFQ